MPDVMSRTSVMIYDRHDTRNIDSYANHRSSGSICRCRIIEAMGSSGILISAVDAMCRVNFVLLEHAKAFEAVAKRGDEEFRLKISTNKFRLMYK